MYIVLYPPTNCVLFSLYAEICSSGSDLPKGGGEGVCRLLAIPTPTRFNRLSVLPDAPFPSELGLRASTLRTPALRKRASAVILNVL